MPIHTGKPIEQVAKDADRDYYMTAEEAKEYGLVDEVVKSRKEIKELPVREAFGVNYPLWLAPAI